MTIHTPGGVSDNYDFSVTTTAPSVFQTGVAGPASRLATVVRADEQRAGHADQSDPHNDTIVIYLTGLGATSPAVDDGMPAPVRAVGDALDAAGRFSRRQTVTVYYAGLVPGYVGLYQINATVPFGVPQGLDIPLVIDQGGNSTSLSVRVVK